MLQKAFCLLKHRQVDGSRKDEGMSGIIAPLVGDRFSLRDGYIRLYATEVWRNADGSWDGHSVEDVGIDFFESPKEPYDIRPDMQKLFGLNGEAEDAVEIWVSPLGAAQLFAQDVVQTTAGTTTREDDEFISLTAVKYGDRVFTMHVVYGLPDGTPPTINPQSVR